jgi:hypothetical protein
MEDIIYSVLDRLPPQFTQVYESIPIHQITSVLGGAYNLTSHVPYLPVILALVAAYISFHLILSSARTAFRATSFVVRYGAIIGALLGGYNWLTSNGNGAQTNAPGRRGQEHWNSRPSRDYPQTRSRRGAAQSDNSWGSTVLNFLDKNNGQQQQSGYASQAAKWAMNYAMGRESPIEAVFNQIKEVVGDVRDQAQEASEGTSRPRRGRRN